MTPVWNFGFFYAHGRQSATFFECGVRLWERKQRTERPVDIGSDQRFLWELWRRKMCGALRVQRLSLGKYPTCRDWVGKPESEPLVVHVTYCHRLSMMLSSEDVCKRRLMELFYLHGGIDVRNLTSKAWNVRQGC